MIFITGGTGLVGSHILLKLCQDGISFQALKRKNSSLKICQNVFEYYNCEELFEEIRKCKILCMNCHTIETMLAGEHENCVETFNARKHD